jgi:hypothetical protein
MVRALLDGRKTQTRRIANIPEEYLNRDIWSLELELDDGELWAIPVCGGVQKRITRCPFGTVGDHLWVREAWNEANWFGEDGYIYKANFPNGNEIAGIESVKWRPFIHMPRWASRILLEITDVRVERLNSISDADARAEGISELWLQEGALGAWWAADPTDPKLHARTPIEAYRKLWECLYGKGSWDLNPYVWAVEFRRI